MDFTISLAHFCEIHGPTSIICTEASTSPCGSCHPCVTPPSEEPLSGFAYNGLYEQPASLKLGTRLPQLTSPFETPPTSPRSPTHNPYFPTFPAPASSAGGRRPSSNFDADPDTCENCQMVVPKKYSDRIPNGAPGSPSKDGRGRNGSPVLRTSQNFPVRRPTSRGATSSTDSSDASDTEQSTSFDSVPASPMLISRATHTHTLNYISSSQPQSPTTYSQLRRTCIRALSTEVLPLGKASGPLQFGDNVAGYTIAYVFRLSDPRARGSLRTYALIAMAGRDGRRATKAFVKITAAFEDIANRIVAMAERVLERESAAHHAHLRPNTANPASPHSAAMAPSMPSAFLSPQKERALSSGGAPQTRNITPVSSFLTAKKVDPDGFPRISRDVMRAKSLAEIVGQENFFVELHSLFCGLLHSLIKQYG